MNGGRASVRLTRYFAASVDEGWVALTEPDSVVRWLGRALLELERGGRLVLEPGAEHPERVLGRVRAIEPGRRLELDWQPPGEEPSRVRLELRADTDGTRLILEHSRLDEQACMEYASRWERSLERLQRRVVGPEAVS